MPLTIPGSYHHSQVRFSALQKTACIVYRGYYQQSRRLGGQYNSLRNEVACVSHVYSMLGACVVMTSALQHTETERWRRGISLPTPASKWPWSWRSRHAVLPEGCGNWA